MKPSPSPYKLFGMRRGRISRTVRFSASGEHALTTAFRPFDTHAPGVQPAIAMISGPKFPSMTDWFGNSRSLSVVRFIGIDSSVDAMHAASLKGTI